MSGDNDELPTGWTICEIGEISQITGGGTPPSKNPANFTAEGGIPWVTPADLSGYNEMFISRGKRNLTEQGLSNSSAKMLPKGALLFSSRAPVGYVAVASNPVCTNQGFKSFVLPEGFDSRFGYYYLRHIKPLAEARATGTTFKELSGGAAYHLPFLIAPLAEQKRIADKLEAVLGRVDACRARLDRVPALLKRFRQSVLAAAVSGKLTEEWRMTNGVNDEWEIAELGSLMESKPRNGYSPKSVGFETPVRSLTLTATTSGRFRGEHSKFINEKIPPSSHLWLVPGDILIQRANTIEYVGVSAIFDGPLAKFIYPDLMMKCRANNRTTTGFLHLLLQSEPIRSHFRDNATGTAGNMPKINQGTVIGAPAVLPPLPEQQEIVRRVEDLFAFADRIEAHLAVAQKMVDRLTPSVLAKAFRGELVPQDPTDEPASALLERLQSQPAPNKPARATRKTRK